MVYTRADIKRVREAIAAKIPEARFHESDYGFGLAVSNNGVGRKLFEIHYDHAGLSTVTAHTSIEDVPQIVGYLRG